MRRTPTSLVFVINRSFKIIILVICLGLSTDTYSQILQASYNLDSLKNKLELISGNSFNDEKEKVDILNVLGYCDYYYHTHPYLDSCLDNCSMYCGKALKLADEIGYQYGKAKACQSLGYAYAYRGRIDSAIFLLSSAKEIFERVGNKRDLAITYNNFSYAYLYAQDQDSTSKYFQVALDLYRELQEYDRIAINLERLALHRRQSKLTESVVEFFKIAFSYREEEGIMIDMALPLIYIADFYLNDIKNPDSALHYGLHALDIIEESGVKYVVNPSIEHYNGNLYAWTSQTIGDCYKDKELYSVALGYYAMVSELIDYNNSAELSFMIPQKISCAEIYYITGDYTKALSAISEGIGLFENLDYKSVGVDERWDYAGRLHHQAFKIYNDIGDYKRALDHFSQYSIYHDSLQEFNYDKARLKFYTESDAIIKEGENEILRRDLAIQALKQEKQELNIFLMLLAIGILIIILGFVYYRFWLKRKLSKRLEINVAEALEYQKQQQQIIVHQAGLTSLGEMAAGIAHEISTPLQNMMFAAESLKIEEKKEKKDKEFVDKMIDEIFTDIDKVNKLIEHVGIFSSQQKTELFERFSVNESIENAISMMKVKLANLNIELQLELQDNLPVIEANTYKLEQVIVNLLNNARDALEQKISILGYKGEKYIRIKSFSEDSSVQIEFSDNGIGIKEENLNKIFNPFFTTKELAKGTGLGLSISYGIIKEMNGTINVKSEYMKGSSFIINIPVWKA